MDAECAQRTSTNHILELQLSDLAFFLVYNRRLRRHLDLCLPGMLRRIKSTIFLSPEKRTESPSPCPSPSKALSVDDEDLTNYNAEQHEIIDPAPSDLTRQCKGVNTTDKYVNHSETVSRDITAPSSKNDAPADSTLVKASPIKDLQRRASAWLGLSPDRTREPREKDNVGRDRPNHHSSPSQCHIPALQADLVSEFSTVDDKEQEILLLIDLRAYLPNLSVPHVKFPPLNVILVLDSCPTSGIRGRLLRQCTIALRIVHNLEYDDHIGILSTRAESAQHRVISAFCAVGHDGKRALVKDLCDSRMAEPFEQTNTVASLQQACQILVKANCNEVKILVFHGSGILILLVPYFLRIRRL